MLFSDIEGSTALLRELGDDYGALLARQRELLRSIWARHAGDEMGTEGDSFFITFRTAADAVAAAVDAQRAMADERWSNGARVRLRIGLHTGEPLAQDEGFVGLDVHRAARIAAVAHGGQVVVSEATRQLVMSRLPPDVGLVDLGTHRLKDLPVAEHLYQLTAQGVDAEFPPLRSLDSASLEFGVLGPLLVARAGRVVTVGGPIRRAILALLILHANHPVTAERLVDAAWGPRGGPTSDTALKKHITALRKVLESDAAGAQPLVSGRQGYELRVDPGSVDVLRFKALVAEGSGHLADERYDQAVRAFKDALSQWRGEALVDVPEASVRPAVEELEEARLAAVEARFEAELGSGRHSELVPEIEALLVDQPRRERLWAHLMVALHRAGQTAAAADAYARAQQALGQPGQLLRALARRIEEHDPALNAPAGAARSQVKLPALSRELIGRASDVAALGELLSGTDARVVTLTGPGGVGKTRLAVEVATRAVQAFPGGVFFVSLAAVTDPKLILPAVASVLEILESPDEALADSLAASLGPDPTLLVLDNLEQLPDAATVIADLVRAAPSLLVITTSRRALRIGAEREYRVGPLGVPPSSEGSHSLTGEDAGHHAAVELFVRRARQVCPDFRLDDENAATVAEICTRLDGVPLAIELAAARSLLLSPTQLLARLGRQLSFLTGGRQDLPQRHRNLRATIDWSYHLLTARQQQLLARLGAYPGSFSVEGAHVVASQSEGADDEDVLDDLLGLVECSLVQRLPGLEETRFRLLETVHEYARERLAESGDEDAVRERMARHVLTWAERTREALNGPDAARALAALRPEDPGLRAALEWGLDDGDHEVAARIAINLRLYWLLEGRLTEGRMWLGRVLEHQQGLPQALASRVNLAAGILAYFQDDGPIAQQNLHRALDAARQAGDEEVVAMSLGYLGALVLGEGDAEGAQAMVEEAGTISDRREFYEGRVLAMSLSAVIAAMNGDVELETRVYEERLEAARQRGDARRIAETLGNLADIALSQGALDQAETYAEEALKLARGVARMVTRDALLTLGRIELAGGSPSPAADSIGEALRLSLDLGQKFEVAQALLALGAVATVQGDHERAARLYGAGDRLQRATSPLDVDLEPDIAEHRQRTRDALGPDAFQVAELDGAAQPLEQVAAFAVRRSST